MMKYKNAVYRADEARAINALRNVATFMGWEFAKPDLLIPIHEDPYFYEPRASLLLMPGVEGWPPEIALTQRTIRLSALLISIGRTNRGEPALYASLRLCVRGKIIDHGCMRFWLGKDRDLWLLTDPGERDPAPVRARLHPSGITVVSEGWWEEEALQAGLTRAHALVP